jgi:hypothetical protein
MYSFNYRTIGSISYSLDNFVTIHEINKLLEECLLLLLLGKADSISGRFGIRVYDNTEWSRLQFIGVLAFL